MTAKKMKPEKKAKTNHRKPPRAGEEPELPIAALLEIADWTLDQALVAASDDPEDIEKVALVRAFMHARSAGVCARTPSESDFHSVMALAIAAMEKRHGIEGLGEYVAEVVDQAMPVSSGPRLRRGPHLVPHLYCMP
jgi:hypothetical protein